MEPELTKEAALAILDLRPSTQSRVIDLRQKVDEGTPTAEEQSEYEAYIRLGNYLSLLQAKARKYLQGWE